MKRILNKKLNRTVLFKESTQWAYLSSKKFLDFFEETEENLKELPDKQKDFDLYIKSEFLTEDDPVPCEMHLVYCPNNTEIRVNGRNFSKYMTKINACECDNLVFETYEKNGETYYLMSLSKKDNLVITKYSKNDINKKEEKLDTSLINYWWFWDNNLSEDEMNTFISSEHNIRFIDKSGPTDKTIRFIKIKKISKYMSSSKGSVDKILFDIQEKFGEEWLPADFGKNKLIEFEKQDGIFIVTDRKENDLEYLESGV